MVGTGHNRAALENLYAQMQRIRVFEELALAAHKAGELPGYLHPSIGQEAVPAGVCAHLSAADRLTSTHRGHGHALAKGSAVGPMMAELYGRATGSCGGKGGSMHIADFAAGMLGANGIVAGGIPIAVGAAQGLRLLGQSGIVACFFGDGAINRGPFLEGLNWAALYKLPVLFVCEDNTFSAFTHTRETTAGPGPAARAEACGVAARAVDGSDAQAVHAAAGEMIEAMRVDRTPRFLHARTYRWEGHTSTDPGAYRSPEELAAGRARDPVARLGAELLAMGMAREALDATDARILAEMTAARDAARAAPWPEPHTAFDDVQDWGAPQWQV
jgi:pyruvate dehydrogenase E1 component alpha subunit